MPYLHYLVRIKFDVLLLTCNTLLVKDRKTLNTVFCVYLYVFELTLGDSEGQESLAHWCWWGRKESDVT